MNSLLKQTQSIRHLESTWELSPVTMEQWLTLRSWISDIHIVHPRHIKGENYYRDYVTDKLAGRRMMIGSELVSHKRSQIKHTSGFVCVERVYDGISAVEFAHSQYVQRPGHITISDYSDAFRASHARLVSEAVWIPRAHLGVRTHDAISPLMVSIEEPEGRTLMREMDLFFKHAASSRAFDPFELEKTVGMLLKQDLYPASDREEWWNGRKKLIRKYIESHLEDPNLGPLQICHLFNMSRATLYRMFEDDGGVRRFIQDRRLHSAVWDLALNGIRRGRLSRVAERWGFSSDANFNRAVKAVFGMPPGAMFRNRWDIRSIKRDRDPTHIPLFEWFEKNKDLQEPDRRANSNFFLL